MAANVGTVHIEVEAVMGDAGRRLVAMEFATRMVEAAQAGNVVHFGTPGKTAVAIAGEIEAYLKDGRS